MAKELSQPSGNSRPMSINQILDLLAQGQIHPEGLLPWSSNYTFLVTITKDDMESLAVYKPRSGERPLWDFPDGTLCYREVATFIVSQALGWFYVPPTVLRSGPHGLGAVQLYIDCDPEEHYFTLKDEYTADFQYLAVLDYITNNADRKSGHCLLGADGRIWSVDHGLTFHVMPKLRTVIWDFAGAPIPDPILKDLEVFQKRLKSGDRVYDTLARLLTREELVAFRQRIQDIRQTRTFPEPDPRRRHVPWPPV